MDVGTILAEYLEQYGYDGLCSDDCGCLIADLAPCGEMSCDCQAGWIDPEKTDDGFYITTDLPKEKL
jgi:hypothetical protein